MLSFELSAIDIVLIVAVLILLSLYVTKKPETSRSHTKPQLENKKSELTKNPKTQLQNQKSKTLNKQPGTDFRCAHHFGYLKNLPRNTSVPDECFGCPQVMQCLFPNEQPKKLLF